MSSLDQAEYTAPPTMVTFNPQYFVPSFIALFAALYPAPWHIRTRNIATLSMIFWMTMLNIVQTINCLVWSDNSDIKATVWGDISATVKVGYNFGLPLSHLVLAKQLESHTSLRPTSPLYDPQSKARHRLVDLCLTIAGPIIGILAHLSNMDRRFYIVEKFGPAPATYWDTWGVIWMAIVPIVAAGACATYTIMALVNIHLRRQQMLSMIASDASVNRSQFYRLMFLTLAELGTCGVRAIFNLLSFSNGPQPMGNRGLPKHNLTIIEQISWSEIGSTGRMVMNLQFFTVIACSYVFLLCFATSQETKKFYWRVVSTIFPCVPADRHNPIRMGSFDTSASTSKSNTRSSWTDYSSKAPISPTTAKGDMSLLEMLGAPGAKGDTHTLDKNDSWGRGGPSPRTPNFADPRENVEAVYLPPYDDGSIKAPSEPISQLKSELP